MYPFEVWAEPFWGSRSEEADLFVLNNVTILVRKEGIHRQPSHDSISNGEPLDAPVAAYPADIELVGAKHMRHDCEKLLLLFEIRRHYLVSARTQ